MLQDVRDIFRDILGLPNNAIKSCDKIGTKEFDLLSIKCNEEITDARNNLLNEISVSKWLSCYGHLQLCLRLTLIAKIYNLTLTLSLPVTHRPGDYIKTISLKE